ncbi:hypothetical protein [Bacillus multifaciens]|uniref:hypothetical protein n=1 Tax=Bacillus multifaciens TaxID=3068506 RepID=UPI002740DEDA|nr:hypothetical protein [Bacillus sp. WLY-B-L8]MDP7979997.1 hypothetical protein [Bacillus sp. WLY-B-L8]
MQLVFKITYHRMYDHYRLKLLQAIGCLNTEELWKQEMNSIGGIALHICEHVKRNTARYSNPDIKFEEGIEEYFPHLDISSTALCSIIEETFANWKREFEKVVNSEQNVEIDIHSLLHLVEHTGYHLGQVVDRVKRIKGKRFGFCQKGLNERNLRDMIEDDSDFLYS